MQNILNEFINIDNFIKGTLSDTTNEFFKIIIRPIVVKNQKLIQFEQYKGTQVFHKNLEQHEFLKYLANIALEYKQIKLDFAGYSVVFSQKNGKFVNKRIANNLEATQNNHNREKTYILNEGLNIPALVDLGIFDKNYKIIKSKYDKFKQINRFIEIVDDAFEKANLDEITILDFGCGKSYLTFILYYYFTQIKHKKTTIIGYDLKEDVVKNCNLIAQNYGYSNLKFYVNDVTKGNLYDGKIDMIITLHACDIATDYALDYAIKNNVEYIFSVPCCQKEINKQLKPNGEYDILLEHGLIRERFCALLTDSIRAEILRTKGYRVDLLEFVDFAHSPKNIMIRAKKTAKSHPAKFDLEKLQKQYNFQQTLYNLQKI